MPAHILLIDHDKTESVLLKAALAETGLDFGYTQVTSFANAVQYLNGNKPAFIFLDFSLPKTSGLKCLADIRQMEGLETVPVIVYTRYVNNETFRKAKALGALDCILKPTTSAELAAVLVKYLPVIKEAAVVLTTE